jgi:phosphomannomutase-like protein
VKHYLLDAIVQQASPEMKDLLRKLREQYVVAIVGGSDFKKQIEQLGDGGAWGHFGPTCGEVYDQLYGPLYALPVFLLFSLFSSISVLGEFDYVFSQNGLEAYKAGVEIHRQVLVGVSVEALPLSLLCSAGGLYIISEEFEWITGCF